MKLTALKMGCVSLAVAVVATGCSGASASTESLATAIAMVGVPPGISEMPCRDTEAFYVDPQKATSLVAWCGNVTPGEGATSAIAEFAQSVAQSVAEGGVLSDLTCEVAAPGSSMLFCESVASDKGGTPIARIVFVAPHSEAHPVQADTTNPGESIEIAVVAIL